MTGPAAIRGGRKRCFLALLPDAASSLALQRSRRDVERAIAAGIRGVRWSEPDALHLTLRFLGDTDAAQIGYFTQALPALARALPSIPARRYGIWPNRVRPRALVLELADDPGLATLAADGEAHACKAGFEPERRGFRAHVTLARLRPGCAFGIVPNPRVAITFGRIALMESTPGGVAPVYTELAGVRLPDA